MESSAHFLAKCGFPAGLAQNGSQWLPPAPAVKCCLFPPTAAVWVSTVPWAPGGSSCGQDRQVDGRMTPPSSVARHSPGLLSPGSKPSLPEQVPVVVDGPSEAPGLGEVVKESFKLARSQSRDAVLAVREYVFENLGVHDPVLVSAPELLRPPDLPSTLPRL